VAAVPQACLEVVPGSGHLVPLERPEATGALLVRFVRGAAPVAPGVAGPAA
jgi:pimeloyl-ACP methyl ester carboxylesterase